MSGRPRPADVLSVTLRPLLAVGALAVGALAVGALVAVDSTATAGRTGGCAASAGNNGYTYAGHQATGQGHGVRATITLTRPAEVAAGHVASWVGVGGPGQGANGGDAWIQAGVATVPGMGTMLYAEVTREGHSPRFVLLEQGVPVGRSHRLAVLEMAGRPGWWRVWVDGSAVTRPVHLRGSSGRWSPIATAESWNGGQAGCNSFGYRFEGVSVAHGKGGGWQAFVPGYRFLDPGYRLRRLASTPESARSLSARSPLPYAFLAASAS
jgi:hypothetical protein